METLGAPIRLLLALSLLVPACASSDTRPSGGATGSGGASGGRPAAGGGAQGGIGGVTGTGGASGQDGSAGSDTAGHAGAAAGNNGAGVGGAAGQAGLPAGDAPANGQSGEAGAGQAGSGAAAGSSSGGSAGASAGGNPAVDSAPRLATTIQLTEVAVWQTVKISLAQKGALVASRNAPVIAGKKASIRAYVEPGAGFSPRMLRGELGLSSSGATQLFTADLFVSGASSDGAPGSVFSFDVPAEQLTLDAQLSVRITDAGEPPATGATPSAARFPVDGASAPLGAAPPGGTLHLVLVPMRYMTDGSGRLPDTSPAQLELYRSLLLAVYPIVEVDLKVHAPVDWSNALTFSGSVDFGSLNSALLDLRANDSVSPDTYYYAVIAPASDLATYCVGTCVTGQSFVVDDPAAADSRVGGGVGFSGESSAWTLAHEVGHLHGRYHAPCGVSSSDPSYPYGNGATGVWGLDRRDGSLQDPSVDSDMMSYCDPLWISDYTYKALYDRTVAVAALPGAAKAPHLLRRLLLEESPEGTLRATRTLLLPPPSLSRPVALRWLDARGARIGEAVGGRFPLSDGGARVIAPLPPAGAVFAEALTPRGAVKFPLALAE